MLFLLQRKALVPAVLLAAALFYGVPSGLAENVSADSLVLQRALKPADLSIPVVTPSRMPEMAVPVLEDVAGGRTRGPMSIEVPRRVSLEQLRRGDVLYPDQDLVGRFVELLTECPPLFGTDD